MKKNRIILLSLLILSLISIFIGVSSGSADIDLSELWLIFTTDIHSEYSNVIFELRLPRVFTAFAVGGLLAVSGVLMQVLLRNPLAEPYILGSSGGAAVAALLSMSFGLGSIWIDISAFSGSLLATLLVFGIASKSANWGPLATSRCGIGILL